MGNLGRSAAGSIIIIDSGGEARIGKPNSLDRQVFETYILPVFAAIPDVRRVLFVGCADYTQDYESYFVGRAYYTIDINPAHALYGATAPGHHFIDSVENVGRYFRPSSLDLILINGVFGYGVNRRNQAEQTIVSCYDLLVSRGTLMLGWNDYPARKPFDPVGLAGLSRFHRVEFPGLHAVGGVRRLPTGDYLADNPLSHVFSFFAKAESHSP